MIYASELNWSVFPLKENSKAPLTTHGFLDSTKDENKIIEYWSKYPNANIGVETGKESGFFVLDVDSKNNGHETLEDLISQHGKLPDTIQAITGGGGSHYLFKYREGIGSKIDIFQSIDIKGDGGYIVVPPSIHPNGNQYEWELSSRPLENEIQEAPEWLIDFIQKPQNEFTKKPSSYWVEVFNNTQEGSRNNNAASLAGHLLRKWVDPLLVGEIMKMWNDNLDRPLDREELNKTIGSIVNKELMRRQRIGVR